MKRNILIITVGIILVGASATLWIHKPHNTKSPRAETPTSSPSQVRQLDPRSIEALKQHEFAHGPLVKTEDLGARNGYPTYVVSYPSDGLTLYALLTLPVTAPAASGYPVVILNHGYYVPGGSTTRSTDYQGFTNAITSGGVAVLRPDYRGHGDSQGTRPNNGDISNDYAVDVLNLYHAIGTYNGLDAKRVGMAGHSMGGAITLRAAVVEPGIKASLYAAGAVGTLTDTYLHWDRPTLGRPATYWTDQLHELEKTYGPFDEAAPKWAALTPYTYLKDITGPVQIHQGLADESINPKFSEDLYQALQKAGKPVEYFTYPGTGHQFPGAGGVLMQQRMRDFFATTL